MRDDLIGYLLGALDPDEHEQIRQKVELDAELQRKVQLVDRSLQPLAMVRDAVEPPCGLAERTCQLLALTEAGPCTEAKKQLETILPVEVSRSAWGADGGYAAQTARDWTMADFVVAAGICLAAACLFFPALANSRWHTQLAGCQDNMRQLGAALGDYSMTSGGYFPVIPPRGSLSYSGVYAAKLNAKGLVPDPRVLLCPAKGSTLLVRIPPLQDIAAAQGPPLVVLHRTTGGDYAYTLGYFQRGHLYGIRNQGRWNYAILSDAPLENLRNASIGTHGRGQNVLFEDGHVRFLATRKRPGRRTDDLFFNDRGYIRAGLHAEDSVLAPSPISPLPVMEGE
jgi:hypothetical protein